MMETDGKDDLFFGALKHEHPCCIRDLMGFYCLQNLFGKNHRCSWDSVIRTPDQLNEATYIDYVEIRRKAKQKKKKDYHLHC